MTRAGAPAMAADPIDLVARLERERRRLSRWMQDWDLASSTLRPVPQVKAANLVITSRSQAAIELNRIDAALRRWFEGRFGQCCRCGQPVEGERLAADPAAPLCGGCQSASGAVPPR